MKNKGFMLLTSLGLLAVALPPISSLLYFTGLGIYNQLLFSGIMAIWCAGLLITRLENNSAKTLAVLCFAAGALGFLFVVMSWQYGRIVISAGGIIGLLIIAQDAWRRRDFDPLSVLLFLYVASSVWVITGASIMAVAISRIPAFGAAILAFNSVLKKEKTLINTLDHDLFDEDEE